MRLVPIRRSVLSWPKCSAKPCLLIPSSCLYYFLPQLSFGGTSTSTNSYLLGKYTTVLWFFKSYLARQTSCPLTITSPVYLSPSPYVHSPTFCFYEDWPFWFCMQTRSYNIWLDAPGLFHMTQYPPKLIHGIAGERILLCFCCCFALCRPGLATVNSCCVAQPGIQLVILLLQLRWHVYATMSGLGSPPL